MTWGLFGVGWGLLEVSWGWLEVCSGWVEVSSGALRASMSSITTELNRMSKSSDAPNFRVMRNKKVGMEGFSPVHPKEEKFMSVRLLKISRATD